MSRTQQSATDQYATIRHEVQDVILRFFLHLDEQEYEPLAQLMAPEGTWLRNGVLLKGPEGVLEAMRARPAGFTTRHLITNIIIDASGEDRADATYYMTVFVHTGEARPAGPVPIDLPFHVSVFREKFARTPQGWRIAELSGTATFNR
jgi:hypothetical protein